MPPVSPPIVSNLVKNWEIEASFKTDLSDWQTIDPFQLHLRHQRRLPPDRAQHMLAVGNLQRLRSKGEKITVSAHVGQKMDIQGVTVKDLTASGSWGCGLLPLDMFRQMGLGNGEVVGGAEMKHQGIERREDGSEEALMEVEGVAIAAEEGSKDARVGEGGEGDLGSGRVSVFACG
ncbi:MAG: hypothetical protein Q9193_005585, partial [Seirophora villosa]